MSETTGAPILPRGTALRMTRARPPATHSIADAYQPYRDHPLTRARLARGLTYAALAYALGVHHSTPSLWLNGTSRPSKDSVRAMARLFDLPETEIASWFNEGGRDDLEVLALGN